MATTIQISEKLQNELDKRKIYNRKSYEKVIWDLIESTMELSEETKRRISKGEKEFREGKAISLVKIKKTRLYPEMNHRRNIYK